MFSTEHLSAFDQRQRAGCRVVTICSPFNHSHYFSIFSSQNGKGKEAASTQKERGKCCGAGGKMVATRKPEGEGYGFLNEGRKACRSSVDRERNMSFKGCQRRWHEWETSQFRCLMVNVCCWERSYSLLSQPLPILIASFMLCGALNSYNNLFSFVPTCLLRSSSQTMLLIFHVNFPLPCYSSAMSHSS